MKKIGILTFHRAVNYGAVLQAYALQKTIKKICPKFKVKVIDFYTKETEKAYAILGYAHPNWFKRVVLYAMKLTCYIPLWSKKRKFRKFVETEFSLTRRYWSANDFMKNPPIMDVYVSGSDQVFNCNNNSKEAYYLSFAKGKSKKVAYAPSFGRSVFDEAVELKVRDAILDFDSLSCRETVGAEFLSRVTKTRVPVVVDPVFLLSREEWSNFSFKPKLGYKYIFVYDLNGGKSLMQIAKKIAQEKGLKIVCQTQRACVFYNITKTIRSSGPREFVGLMANAEYVVTDSFHGTAFSVLFKKKFCVYIATPHSASRIETLVKLLDLEHCVIQHGKESNFEIESTYEFSNYKRLDNLIHYSKIYLRNSCK